MSAAVALAVRALRRIAGGHARAHHWAFVRDGHWTSRTPKGPASATVDTGMTAFNARFG